MSEIKLKNLRDKDGGELFYPYTHADAVIINRNGIQSTLTDELLNIKNTELIAGNSNRDDKLSQYISELYIDNQTNTEYNFYLYSIQMEPDGDGLTVQISTSPGNASTIVLSIFRKKLSTLISDSIINMSSSIDGLSGYAIWNGNADYYVAGGLSWRLSDAVFKLSNWDDISSNISDNKYTSLSESLRTMSETVSNIRNTDIVGTDRTSVIYNYISELYINNPDNVALYIYTFTNNPGSNEFSILLSTRPGDSSSICMSIFRYPLNTLSSIKPIEFKVSNGNFSGYVLWNGNMSSYSNTGVSWKLENSVYQLHNWSVINDYILSNATNDIQTLTTSVNNLDSKVNKTEYRIIPQNGIITDEFIKLNQFIKELYLTGSDIEKVKYIWVGSKSAIQFSDNDSNIIFAVGFTDTYRINDNIYSIYKYENYDIDGYVVFNDIDEQISISRTNILVNNIELYYNSTINKYITTTKYTVSLKNYFGSFSLNKCIKELYIPKINQLGDLYISRIYCYSVPDVEPVDSSNDEKQSNVNNGYSFWLVDSTNEIVISSSKRVTKFYYECESITYLWFAKDVYAGEIKIASKNDIAGYIILKEGSGGTGEHRLVNKELCSSLDKNPHIKNYLNSNEQLIILGDSKFGHESIHNAFADMLRGLTNKKVYNLGFGGCRMAWRSDNGTDTYDSFSAVEIADSFVSQDFSRQYRANNELISQGINYYAHRVPELANIDFTKPITILLNYQNNDCTGGNLLGDYYKLDGGKTLNEYDKTKFLDAMNYAVEKICKKYPFIKIICCESWGGTMEWEDEQHIAHLSKASEYRNPKTGLTGSDFAEAHKKNARLMNLGFIDFESWGGMTVFNNMLGYSTECWGTEYTGGHFNARGYTEAAKYIYNKLKGIFC